jgi:hypothetical protein
MSNGIPHALNKLSMESAQRKRLSSTFGAIKAAVLRRAERVKEAMGMEQRP